MGQETLLSGPALAALAALAGPVQDPPVTPEKQRMEDGEKRLAVAVATGRGSLSVALLTCSGAELRMGAGLAGGMR